MGQRGSQLCLSWEELNYSSTTGACWETAGRSASDAEQLLGIVRILKHNFFFFFTDIWNWKKTQQEEEEEEEESGGMKCCCSWKAAATSSHPWCLLRSSQLSSWTVVKWSRGTAWLPASLSTFAPTKLVWLLLLRKGALSPSFRPSVILCSWPWLP